MSASTASISLSDLSSAGVPLNHSDAVTIAREAAVRAARGELPGIPAPEEFRLRTDGEIEVNGPAAHGNEIRRLARLLAALLAHAVQDVQDPAAFRLVLARAFADDESAYGSLDEFLSALTPFAGPDPDAVLRRVASNWDHTSGIDQFAAETDSARFVATSTAQPREVQPFRRERTWYSRGWIPAVATVAVLAAVLPALWFFTRSRPAPAAQEQTAERKAEGTTSRNAAEPTKTDVATPLEPDRAGNPAPPMPVPTAGTPAVATPKEPAAKRPAPTEARPTEPTELIPSAAFSPSFASAASAMFYHSGSGPGSAIMRAETDNTGMVLRVTSVVDDRGSNFHPRPSPDGQLLAFDSDRDGERGIYLADANGKGVRRVSGPGFAAVPSWSPDGRRLAFVRADDERPSVWNIWTLDVATGDSRRITSHRFGQPWGAAWFPDGERIAYSHEDRLIVRTLQGSDVRIFDSPIRGRLVRTPAVSPDGTRIIFQVRRDGAWMLELPTGSIYRVLEDPSAEEFTWSQDGRRVAYHSRRSGTWGVWLMAPR